MDQLGLASGWQRQVDGDRTPICGDVANPPKALGHAEKLPACRVMSMSVIRPTDAVGVERRCLAAERGSHHRDGGRATCRSEEVTVETDA
jgi:hypothetical protein